ncbi:uncharacterized protein [Nicotiana tomentosiformis]|uniref:uncharacterized protein n=1 Tax=Nicotiana tomentosiformis TaxID=4098 RepID=UPI00051AACDC|nr:uncharacterized protein LOC104113359 [Nicotiana tomentosiformis]
MVVKMVKIKKFQVKIRTLKLELGVDDNIEAFDGVNQEPKKVKMMAIKMKWKGEPKFGLVPFHYKQKKGITSRRIVKKLGQAANSIEWDNDGDEFENICCFTEVSGCYQSLKYSPWDVSFNVLYSSNLEAKMVVIGKMVVNVAEMASKMVSEVEEKLPITLNIGRVSVSATLHVKVKFAEIRDVQDSAGSARESNQLQSLAKSKSLCDRKAQKANQLSQEDDSDESSTFEAVEPKAIESGSLPSLETQPDSVNKVGWFSWKRRRLSLRPTRSKAEPLIKKSRSFSVVSRLSQQNVGKPEPSTKSKDKNEGSSKNSAWEMKELHSRDGQTWLKTNVFFASFDQCSDKAAGESACTALVAVISHWLQSNRDAMPTRSEFDNLILHGSSEWRKLCQNDTYISDFPNKHFDLETILRAGIRPIAISHDQSFVGFFSPDKFESLQGVMSFDQIWDMISSFADDITFEPRVYIISWNDHFFVLKVEANAYYIIDTLGERLFEGCNKAYILKFDDNAMMYKKVYAEEKSLKNDTKAKENGEQEMICKGKECCREFIKRFLAAIPLKELEEQEKKETTVSYFSLHHRLQIEFNSSYLLSSSSSSLTSSPFSSFATSTPSYL